MEKALRFNRKEDNNKLERLTLMELLVVVKMATFHANNLPISTETSLTPNHLIHGTKFCLLDGPSHQSANEDQNFTEVQNKLCNFEKTCEQELLKALTSHEAKFVEKTHNDGNQVKSLNLQPQVDDICVIKQDTVGGIEYRTFYIFLFSDPYLA